MALITSGLCALQWGVPGWVGNGSYFSDANIAYQTSFVKGARDVYNIR